MILLNLILIQGGPKKDTRLVCRVSAFLDHPVYPAIRSENIKT